MRESCEITPVLLRKREMLKMTAAQLSSSASTSLFRRAAVHLTRKESFKQANVKIGKQSVLLINVVNYVVGCQRDN